MFCAQLCGVRFLPKRSTGEQIRSDIREVVAHSAVTGDETLFGKTAPSETVSDKGLSERGLSKRDLGLSERGVSSPG